MTDIEAKAREIANLFCNPLRYAYEREAVEIKIATALREAKSQALTDWQPIETAPKDGTEVLLWTDEYPRVVSASYREFGEWEGWTFTDEALADIQPEGPREPSHWMPLPPPPSEVKK